MIFQSLPFQIAHIDFFSNLIIIAFHTLLPIWFLPYIIIEQLSWKRVEEGKKGNTHFHPLPFYVPGDVVHVGHLGFAPSKKREILSSQNRCFSSKIKKVLTGGHVNSVWTPCMWSSVFLDRDPYSDKPMWTSKPLVSLSISPYFG